MRTDALIAELATRPPTTRRSGAVATVVVAALVSTIMLIVVAGARQDLAQAARTMTFYYKVVLALGILVAGSVSCRDLMCPQSKPRWAYRLAPVAIWVILGLGTQFVALPGIAMQGTATEGAMCAVMAVACSLLPAICAFLAMRSGAPRLPAAAGAAAGFMGAGFGLLVYTLHCPIDTPFFVAVSFGIATLVVVLPATVLGRRFLIW